MTEDDRRRHARSRPSWLHADLEILLAVSDDPKLFASADHEDSVVTADYADIPRWLRAARPTGSRIRASSIASTSCMRAARSAT